MGERPKLLYRDGQLLDALTGEVRLAWDVEHDIIDPSNYVVYIETKDGDHIAIYEDEDGVWVNLDYEVKLCMGVSSLNLPTFEGHPHEATLRVLHHEILANVMPHGPVPNFFVYPKPWFRDAAMMAMVLDRTGNAHLLDEWILSLRDPFDHNNGVDEPDNLGQALYLISLASDKEHPLVSTILDTIPHYVKESTSGSYICGPTDGREHPVYQTMWLKFGLRALGLDDPYVIPGLPDSYSTLFWWDFKNAYHGPSGGYHPNAERYPYLTWAEAHFFGSPPPMHLTGQGYPLTWEAHASQADYEGMRAIDAVFVERKLCAPHTWHAAEMFLYLHELV